MCGCFTEPQLGHVERAGAASFQFEARRCRVFARGVFRFGTAISGAPTCCSCGSCECSEVELGERGPTRIAGVLVVGTVVGANEDPTPLDGSAVVALTRRGQRQPEHEGVAHELLEVELV